MEAPETVKDGSDAIGRRKPGRAGYRTEGGEALTLSWQTPFSSGLSAAYQPDGRRRKKETAAPFKATLIFNYNTHLSATAVPTLRVGRRRLVSGSSVFM